MKGVGVALSDILQRKLVSEVRNMWCGRGVADLEGRVHEDREALGKLGVQLRVDGCHAHTTLFKRYRNSLDGRGDSRTMSARGPAYVRAGMSKMGSACTSAGVAYE
jgi:hypothetical protein